MSPTSQRFWRITFFILSKIQIKISCHKTRIFCRLIVFSFPLNFYNFIFAASSSWLFVFVCFFFLWFFVLFFWIFFFFFCFCLWFFLFILSKIQIKISCHKTSILCRLIVFSFPHNFYNFIFTASFSWSFFFFFFAFAVVFFFCGGGVILSKIQIKISCHKTKIICRLFVFRFHHNSSNFLFAASSF